MNKIISFLLIIIFAAVFVVVGAFGLYFYQTHYGKMPIAQPAGDQADQQLSELKSSAVNSLVLYGQVLDISGQIVTLSGTPNDISSTINSDATVDFVDVNGKTTPAKFSDIKVGSVIEVRATISENDQLQGYDILINKK